MKNSVAALAFASLVLIFTGPTAQAALVVDPSFWTGTRTAQVGGGITAFDQWAGTSAGNIVQLSYQVTQNAGLYTYSYTISGLGGVDLTKAVSHAIFETSLTFTSENLKAGTSGNASIGWQDDGTGNNNPGLGLGAIYGIYFDFGGNDPTYTIVTDRSPVWGDFYAKNGNNSNNYGWNTGLGTDPTENSLSFVNWIPTPDTTGGDDGGGSGRTAPVPAAALGGGVLLAGLATWRRLRRKSA